MAAHHLHDEIERRGSIHQSATIVRTICKQIPSPGRHFVSVSRTANAPVLSAMPAGVKFTIKHHEEPVAARRVHRTNTIMSTLNSNAAMIVLKIAWAGRNRLLRSWLVRQQPPGKLGDSPENMGETMSLLKKLLAAALCAEAIIALCAAGPLQAQEAWPARPIQMIVPSSPGSGTDALARVMARRLSESLKQSVVVENRPGGSGVIGTNAVLKAAPDGYTILYTTASNMVVAPAVIKPISQEARKSLVPIAQTAVGGVLLLVSPDLPVHDLPGLIALVKANPDKYSYGSWGTGSSAHLTMEWLKKQTGMKTEHVAYRTSSQLLTELSSGVLKIGWTDPSVAVPFLQSGKVRGIAIVGNVRSPQLADVKTMGEQGYKFSTVGWFGMFAPAGTSPAIAKRLADEVNKVQALPEIAALMKKLNFEPPPVKSSAQLGEIVRNDLQVWTKIANDAGIRLEE